MVTFLNEVFIGRASKILVATLLVNLLFNANIYIDSISFINTFQTTERNEEEEKENTEKNLSVELEAGVERVLSGNKSIFNNQEVEIVSETTMDAENGIMTVKSILLGTEGQQEKVLSEIQISTETYETKIVIMEENYRSMICPPVEEERKFSTFYVTEAIQTDTIIHEDALAKVPQEMQIPSDGTFISAFGPSDQYMYLVEKEEEMILAKLIEAEAGDQDIVGKVLVGAIVLNRLSDGGFGSSINEIITAEGQFASISNRENVNPECMKAAQMALKGWDPSRLVFEDGALYFHATYANVSKRKNVVLKLLIGEHYCAREYGK